MDETAAARNPFFDGRVAHGYFLCRLAAGLFVDPAGAGAGQLRGGQLRFLKPVYPGDSYSRLTCQQISPRDGDYGEVRWDTEVTNQDGAVAAQY